MPRVAPRRYPNSDWAAVFAHNPEIISHADPRLERGVRGGGAGGAVPKPFRILAGGLARRAAGAGMKARGGAGRSRGGGNASRHVHERE